MLPRAYVVYFDGANFSVAAEGLRFANGINVSPGYVPSLYRRNHRPRRAHL